ncbi:MAG: DNA replication and repair protein RecF [Bacteroidales bacterium]|nr:DNA replication and repair protein RecF [Bacteroidales bacterium]
MATLSRIVVQDFRNIALGEISFSPNINCISGNNGEGKTNLMDAIWYLSMCKSAFSSSDKYNFRHGTDSFSLSGTYNMDSGAVSTFSMKVTAGGEKRLRRDDKPYPRISEHIGELPIVMVSPSDTVLVSDSGEERRKFLNAVLSQLDREYLSAVQQYNRLLLQRNRLLKETDPDWSLLDVFGMRMEPLAKTIHESRKKFTESLAPVVSKYYSMISGQKESISIAYSSDLEGRTLSDVLLSHKDRDLVLRYTTAGVHRDDLEFTLGPHPIRRCGSQGQQKSFLVALKFAQYEIMKEGYGFPPMLLLDDVFDKLDLSRISNLLEMVAGSEFGQIFITDSNKVRLRSIVDGITTDRAYIETVDGTFTREA